ncbi:replication protein [Paenibacillus phocaensis]|uniref:replication protein n=1 Tax=Paenibacillus phocaensis TaxID=1776378 RepID=UPI000839BE3B|nr:replication protein [Paenibacillus phocaensis]
MANPQLEDGYTQLANELLEQAALHKFNGTQYAIILVIWRYTYGFKRKEHQLATGFIAKAVGADLSGVKEELNKLIERRVVLVTKEGKGPRPRSLSFNKNYEEWLPVDNSPPLSKKASGGQSSTIMVDNSPPIVVDNSPPKKEKRKYIKKGDIYMSESPKKLKFHDTVFLTLEQYEKLCAEFGKQRVDDTIEALDEWQSNKKPSQHKKDHYKTLRVWIKKDMERSKARFKPMAQRNKEELDILNQFYEEGAAREANGCGEVSYDDQDRLSLL